MIKLRQMENLLERAVSRIYPSREALEKVLASGRKLRIYFGIDPTGPDLHLGHAVPLRKLRQFQDLGHTAILLIGDFTAMIGDPTDKLAARTQLSRAEVLANSKNYLAQAGKILDLSKTEVRYNSEWLAKLNFAELVELASHLTVPRLLKRNMFQERLAAGKDIFLHEFMYPLLQGYDSVALDVDMEIGGNDQIFNMLVGRDLMKSLKNKEKFVLATKLLAAPGELKMSKTEGNMVTLADAPGEMYGKVMSWPDGLVAPTFELLTRLTDLEIKEILAAHPRDAKMRLAYELVADYHGKEAAAAAEKQFVDTFQKGEAPAEWQKVIARQGEKLAVALARSGAVESKTAFRRLVAEKAIREWPGRLLADPEIVVARGLKLKIGKKRFVEIVIE